MNDPNYSFLFLLIVHLACCCASAQEEQMVKSWQDRLPVSLNGKNPINIPDGFEKTHWHSMRLHPGCATRVIKAMETWGDGDHYPDVKKFKELKVFKTKEAELLKTAIIDDDLEKISRLIDEGVDINETGLGGLTALHIAFFLDTNPQPFELLLKNGADPTVNLTFDADKPFNRFFSGKSVAHFAAMSKYNRLFPVIFQDKRCFEARSSEIVSFVPVNGAFNEISVDSFERLKIFADAGSDFASAFNLPSRAMVVLNSKDDDYRDRPHAAKLVKGAIKLGADCSEWFKIKKTNHIHYGQVIHLFAQKAIQDPEGFLDKKIQELVKVLEQKGYSLEEAKSDLTKWKKWHDQGLGELIEIEHQMRLKDSTGEALKRWRETELESKAEELMKGVVGVSSRRESATP